MHPHLQFVDRAFGLPTDLAEPPPAAHLPAPLPGTIVAITGPSGAGKTRALDALCARTPGARAVAALTLDELERPVLALFDPSSPTADVLRGLSRVGLADARLWPRPAATLSAGELRRLEIARALARGPLDGPLVLDEFDAHLDDTTARMLSLTLRRLCASQSLGIVLSTHRPMLLPWLAPARVIRINGGQATEVAAPAAKAPGALLDEMIVRRGRAGDYAHFARWHYAGSRKPGPCTDVFIAEHEDRPIAIAVFAYPHMLLGSRRSVLPPWCWPENVCRHGAAELNRDLRLLSRVVVEPRYRGAGLARMLVSEALRHVDAPWVECLAQMGDFSGFLLGAGFTRVGECPTPVPMARLRETMAAFEITTADLLDAPRRERLFERLSSPERELLRRRLRAALRTRIETGHGAMRGQTLSPFSNLDLLAELLRRMHSRPTYFLWRRP